MFYDLDVPDYTKGQLAMSGVALTSATGGVTPDGPADPLPKQTLPGPMTTYREFCPVDELAMFAEVYDGGGAASAHRSTSTTRPGRQTRSGRSGSRERRRPQGLGVPERPPKTASSAIRAQVPRADVERGRDLPQAAREGAPHGRPAGAARGAHPNRRSRRPTSVGPARPSPALVEPAQVSWTTPYR